MAGLNKFIILSAHGQVSSTIVAVHKLGIEGYFTLSLHWYDFVRDNQTILEDPMWHADEAETSVALYLYPDLVDMSKATKGGGKGIVDSKWKIAPGMQAKPGQMYHFEGTFALPERDGPWEAVVGDFHQGRWRTLEKIRLGNERRIQFDEDRATCLILLCRPEGVTARTAQLTEALLRPDLIEGY